MLKQFINTLDSISFPLSCSLDFATGTLEISGKQYTADLSGYKRLTSESISNGYFCNDDFVRDCEARGWKTVDHNGILYAYTVTGECIGDEMLCRKLIAMDIVDPCLADAGVGTKEFDKHRMCTVGFSRALGNWVTWCNGDFMSASSREEACKYSCLNSKVSMRSTMDLKAFLLNCLRGHYRSSGEIMREPTREESHVPGDQDETHIPEGKDFSSLFGDMFNLTLRESEGAPERTTVPAPIGRRTGEHRQHNIHVSRRNRISAMPQSGDHRQHNLHGINENPGYRMPMVEMSAEASALDPLDTTNYTWYRFTGARNRNIPTSNQHYDLIFEPNDIYGLRQIRGGAYTIMTLESVKRSQLFRVEESVVNKLLKFLKPYRGKIRIKGAVQTTAPVQPSISDVKPPKPRDTTVKIKHEDKIKPSVIREESARDLLKLDQIFVGFFQPSIFEDRYRVLFSSDEKHLVDLLTSNVTELKNVVPVAFTLPISTKHPFVKANIQQKRFMMDKRVADRFMNQGENKARRITFSKKMDQFSRKPKEPHNVDYVPKAVVLPGNDVDVLVEIRNAISTGYFSAEFSPAIVHNNKLIEIPNKHEINKFDMDTGILQKPARLVLACDNTSPLFLKEAELTALRIARSIGPMRTQIKQIKAKTPDSDELREFTVLILALDFDKVKIADIKRAKRLYELTRTTDRVSASLPVVKEISTCLTRIQETEREIGSSETREKRDNARIDADNAAKHTNNPHVSYEPERVVLRQKLARLIKEREDLAKQLEKAYSSTLVLNAPIYAIKVGNTWLAVEVVDYDIHKGTVTVRQIRGGNRKTQEVTELWLYSNHKKFL